MKKVRIILNWLILLTVPLWGGFAITYCMLADLYKREYEARARLIKGDKWILS